MTRSTMLTRSPVGFLAEVLLDAVYRVTGLSTSRFPGIPPGTRAAAFALPRASNCPVVS